MVLIPEDSTGCPACVFPSFLHDLLFDPEDRGGMFLQNICDLIPDYMMLHPRR
jgi:hypothetical protein